MNEKSQVRWSLESYCIGMKLRALRTRRRITLSRLAAETGLSTALLSKLETDRMVPTLPTLAAICRVYGVGLSHFFIEANRHNLSITRKAHLKANSRGQDAVRFTPIYAAIAQGALDARIVELAAGSSPYTPGSGGVTHAVLYVIEGILRMDVAGVQEALDAGDVAYIDSEVSMSWSAGGKQPCHILQVSPGGKG
jgi:transcriptional regulator with XRE-family HTH domain